MQISYNYIAQMFHNYMSNERVQHKL